MRCVPKELRCIPIFHKVWKYRSYYGGKFVGYSTLKNIWICSGCKLWGSNKHIFNQVCNTKDRRKRKRGRRSMDR